MEYRELLNKLYTNDNCFILEENQDILFKVMQRSIYKKRPFHYGGADSVITESLINIKSLIDTVYVTEEQIRSIFLKFKEFVLEINIRECK